MARKPRKLTRQEDLVARFAKHSISSGATFHPDQWSSGTEPADMIISIGRAMVFVNMTQSGSWLEQLIEHNISQARDRMVEWQTGKQIRGKNDHASFQIGWDDVDHIAVISVVDGRHAACMRHHPDLLKLSPKVAVAATVTSAVVSELAQLGGGARELVNLCASLPYEQTLSQSEARHLVRSRHDQLMSQALVGIRESTRRYKGPTGGRAITTFEQSRIVFEGMRNQQGGHPAFADLDWADVFQACAFITHQTAEIEGLEVGSIRGFYFGSETKFMVFVSTNMTELANRTTEFLEMAKEAGCAFTYFLSSMAFGDTGMIVEFDLPAVTGLARALEAARKSA